MAGLARAGQVCGSSSTYDAGGRRATAASTSTRFKLLTTYKPPGQALRYYDDDGPIDVTMEGGTWGSANFAFTSTSVETYSYRADGALETVSVAVQDLAPIGDLGTTSPQVGALGASVVRATFVRDAMGRVTSQKDWLNYAMGDAAYDRTVGYNAKGQIESETVISKQAIPGTQYLIV